MVHSIITKMEIMEKNEIKSPNKRAALFRITLYVSLNFAGKRKVL